MRLFEWAGEIGIHDHDHNEQPVTGAMQLNLGYSLENGSVPRWERYARNIGAKRCRLPEIKRLPRESLDWAEQYRGAFVLAPWSGWPRRGAPIDHPNNRIWLLSHWLRLERLILDSGFRAVVLDDNRGRNEDFLSDVLAGRPSVDVAALMLVSECLIGIDSGLAHLSGLLGVPTIALCGPSRGHAVFGIYPSVQVLDGASQCARMPLEGAKL